MGIKIATRLNYYCVAAKLIIMIEIRVWDMGLGLGIKIWDGNRNLGKKV